MTEPNTTTGKIFGREPALWLAVVAAAVQLVAYWVFPLTDAQQGVINAVATALFGTITAFAVSAEKGVPFLLGLLQALIALALAFGLKLDPGAQVAIMAFATTVASFITRTQVVAPVPPSATVRSWR
jgi:hypothetical protein